MFTKNTSTIDMGSKFFTTPTISTMTLKELRNFASKRNITIPSKYIDVEEIREYIKIQVRFSEIDT